MKQSHWSIGMNAFRLIAYFAALALLSQFAAAKPVPRKDNEPADPARPRVALDTNHGKVVVELYADKAPNTVKNFLQYVDDRFYEGTIFHRVIKDFMIQGGGHVPGLTEKQGRAAIRNESANGLSNVRGTIAMARTQDPHSATSQFFINVKDNMFLDQAKSPDKIGYCVFGKVLEGMDVIDKIRMVNTVNQGGHSDVPAENVVIRSIRRVP
jgi:cyclophilin family peptidyl-prolyl cis-trans isomerase